jgi:hypothetical protein
MKDWAGSSDAIKGGPATDDALQSTVLGALVRCVGLPALDIRRKAMARARKRIATVALAALVAVGFAVTAWAAGFLYFKDSPIVGEAPVPHGGWIELETLAPPTRATGSGTLRFTKRVDKASPQLAEARSRGQIFPIVVLSVPAQGSSAYIRYNLTRVLISSYSVSGSGNAAIETVTIVFERIDPS